VILIQYTEQTFGVDLEARARADRKRVPVIVTTILTFLDNRKFRVLKSLLIAHGFAQIILIWKATRLVEAFGSLTYPWQLLTTFVMPSTQGKPFLATC